MVMVRLNVFFNRPFGKLRVTESWNMPIFLLVKTLTSQELFSFLKIIRRSPAPKNLYFRVNFWKTDRDNEFS